jgi:hypothetical protein
MNSSENNFNLSNQAVPKTTTTTPKLAPQQQKVASTSNYAQSAVIKIDASGGLDDDFGFDDNPKPAPQQ